MKITVSIENKIAAFFLLNIGQIQKVKLFYSFAKFILKILNSF